MKPSSPSIRDVAEKAGVSIATVSNVIHKKEHLYSAPTAERVMKVVQALDYRPNQLARSLVRQKADALGIVVEQHHDPLARPDFLTPVLNAFVYQARAFGLNTHIIPISGACDDQITRELENGTIDGVAVLAPSRRSRIHAWLEKNQGELPAILVEADASPDSGTPWVAIDHYHGIFQAVRHLTKRGHRRIALMNSDSSHWFSQHHERAWRDALAMTEIAPPEDWLVQSALDPLTSALHAGELLDHQTDITAIVAADDWIALGALRAMEERHIRVPEQMSLVGFHNIRASSYTKPALTTIAADLGALGRKAAISLAHLTKAVKLVDSKPHDLVKTNLVERASVATCHGRKSAKKKTAIRLTSSGQVAYAA